MALLECFLGFERRINNENTEGTSIKWFDESEIKLILKPLKIMTEQEAWEMIGGKELYEKLYENATLKITNTGIDVWYELGEGGSRGYECNWDSLPPKKFR